MVISSVPRSPSRSRLIEPSDLPLVRRLTASGYCTRCTVAVLPSLLVEDLGVARGRQVAVAEHAGGHLVRVELARRAPTTTNAPRRRRPRQRSHSAVRHTSRRTRPSATSMSAAGDQRAFQAERAAGRRAPRAPRRRSRRACSPRRPGRSRASPRAARAAAPPVMSGSVMPAQNVAGSMTSAAIACAGEVEERVARLACARGPSSALPSAPKVRSYTGSVASAASPIATCTQREQAHRLGCAIDAAGAPRGRRARARG